MWTRAHTGDKASLYYKMLREGGLTALDKQAKIMTRTLNLTDSWEPMGKSGHRLCA